LADSKGIRTAEKNLHQKSLKVLWRPSWDRAWREVISEILNWLFCLFACSLTAFSAQIGYIATPDALPVAKPTVLKL